MIFIYHPKTHFCQSIRYIGNHGIAFISVGINPYFAGEYDTAIRNYPVKKTMRAIALLREYDRRSKSNTRGEASDGDLLKELIAKILA